MISHDIGRFNQPTPMKAAAGKPATFASSIPRVVGAVAASNTGVTPPAHKGGNLFLGFAGRSADNTAIAIGANGTPFVSLGAKAGSAVPITVVGALGFKIAASAAEVASGWTNAQRFGLAVLDNFRLEDEDDLIANIDVCGGSTEWRYPSLASRFTDGRLRRIFCGHQADAAQSRPVPDGFVRLFNPQGSPEMAMFVSKKMYSSFAGISVLQTGTSYGIAFSAAVLGG